MARAIIIGSGQPSKWRGWMRAATAYCKNFHYCHGSTMSVNNGNVSHTNPVPLIPKVLFRKKNRERKLTMNPLTKVHLENACQNGGSLNFKNTETFCLPVSLFCADEELRAICIWSTVCHRQRSCHAVAHNAIKKQVDDASHTPPHILTCILNIL